MKTFLNVLFRRILYRIPLKFLLVLLVIVAIFIASFSSAENVEGLITYIGTGYSISVSSNSSVSILDNISHSDTYCLEILSASNTFEYGFNSTIAPDSRFSVRVGRSVNFVCLTPYTNESNYLVITNPFDGSTSISYKMFKLNVLLGTNIPVMSSIQCQTEYNLIPISSVDQNYCTTNNLCPSCPAGSGGVSTLYINDILHIGSPYIYMTIPEEIGRDYEYTQGGTNMLIDVEGYNVDYEKMQSVIDQQNYKPTQEDFQNLILILGPYSQIILFFVFLFLIWAWIKKPFKSKKI